MRTKLVLVVVFCGFLAVPAVLLADRGDISAHETTRFNNENWDTLPHPPVASFTVYGDGSADGYTTTHIPFRQYTVLDENGIRVQRFEIQDHYHFIIQGEIANSEDELSELLTKYRQKKETQL